MFRFNLPSDLERSDDYYYIADFNNDCIRRLHQDGSVLVVITIHSKPFALSSNLFVAARKRVFKVGKLPQGVDNFLLHRLVSRLI